MLLDRRDIIVIGGSAGSLKPLRTLLGGLSADLAASVFIVVHRPQTGPHYLGQLLTKGSALPVTYAHEYDAISPGRVLIGPAGKHLLLSSHHVVFGHGPKEVMARPSINALFRSAALAFGPRVIGVLLSGLLNDGASGLAAIRELGGVGVVQDPAEAEAPDMPRAALATAGADFVVGAEGLAGCVARLVQEPPALGRPAPLGLQLAVDAARGPGGSRPRRKGGGGLSPDIEEALLLALRILEEREELVSRLAKEVAAAGKGATLQFYSSRKEDYRRNAQTLRSALADIRRVEAVEPAYDETDWATGI